MRKIVDYNENLIVVTILVAAEIIYTRIEHKNIFHLLYHTGHNKRD